MAKNKFFMFFSYISNTTEVNENMIPQLYSDAGGKSRNIIIIGASSGIGRELALLYGRNKSAKLGLVARRTELLSEIAGQIAASCEITSIDMASPERGTQFKTFLSAFESIDMIVFCAGFGEINSELTWPLCRKTLDVNVMGFTEIMNQAYDALAKQKHGHLAAVASVGGLRGFEDDSGYSASKSYQLRYMEGLARKARKERSCIHISTILPGYVDTAMAKGGPFFWMCSAASAAQCISRGLLKKRRYIFVTGRWRLIAGILQVLSWRIFERL